jgi:hypothetical protein
MFISRLVGDDEVIKMKIVSVRLAAGLLIWLAIASPADFAQAPPHYVGIPKGQFNFIAPMQQQSEWSWAAGVQMVLNYYGIQVSQREILSRIISVTDSDDAITASLNGQAFDKEGRTRSLTCVSKLGMVSPAILINELSHNRPILVLFGDSDTSRAIVITAALFVDTETGPQVVSLFIRDTLAREGDVGTQIGGSQLLVFASQVEHSWMVTVH